MKLVEASSVGVAIGQSLPFALAIAASPVAIFVLAGLLLSPRARVVSVGFLTGWTAGIVLAISAFTWITASVLPAEVGGGAGTWVGVASMAIGTGLIALAALPWLRRRRSDESTPPRWLRAVDGLGFFKAAGLGLALSALSPKKLLVVVGAGLSIGAADLDSGQTVLTLVVFTAVAASTVALPVIAYLLTQRRVGPAIDRVRRWLIAHNSTVVAIVLIAAGAILIRNGLIALT